MDQKPAPKIEIDPVEWHQESKGDSEDGIKGVEDHSEEDKLMPSVLVLPDNNIHVLVPLLQYVYLYTANV